MATNMRLGAGNRTARQPAPARPVNNAAIDAMRPAFQNVPARGIQAPGTAPVAGQMAPPVDPGPPQVTPTAVDQTQTNQIYQDQLAQSDKDRELMQTVGLNTISGLQTRNASNAARMGLQAGGASYLSGQRSAAIQGTNAFNQGLQQWGTQRQGIYTGAANIASGAQTTNANNINNAGINNVEYDRKIAEQKAAEQATQNANIATGDVAQVKADFDYLFNKHNFKAGGGQYNSLLKAFENAKSTGSPQEQQAAYQALMAYITPIQQAREAWLKSSSKAQGGSFEDFYKEYSRNNGGQ